MALLGDARFLPDLFARLKAGGPADAEAWEDQVAFLQELTGLAKHLQPSNRSQLLAKLAHLGLFEVRGFFFSGSVVIKCRAHCWIPAWTALSRLAV
jgi:hypothetical protein